ncbi:carbamoyltransferase [Azospirillum brasilense]|uniref:carbamoyltransferase family protein n=1 Tax=Azospirillum brasilense TaxID=192 RepID=UPI001EDC2AA4|nr:carbamoyltransferase N-terminal domain-containing protein [Azospirillum brasilense]UKJ78132.1 hypothetical protein H1Q64_32565 [Azospirillum brasilense]
MTDAVKHILGVSAFYHDSAAALLRDSEVVAAAEEERFSRRKHDRGFPDRAIKYCLSCLDDGTPLDAVVFYENLVRSTDRVVQNAVMAAPDGYELWQDAVKALFAEKFGFARRIADVVGAKVPVFAVEHHIAHAASAFFPSPFENAAILVVDGVGEWATTSIGVGQGNAIKILKEIRYPHSLGLLYAAFTYYCGFKVNSGEYKLMGLAPFGKPRYVDVIMNNIIDVKRDGSFRLNMKYFGFLRSQTIINKNFEDLFEAGRREPESSITEREADLAASIQKVTELVMMRLAIEARRITNQEHLVLAGGVALNCVANGAIWREGIFKDIWVQPAAGDAGGALGGALTAMHGHFGVPRARTASGDRQQGSRLGPRYDADAIDRAIEQIGCVGRIVADPAERHAVVADALSRGEIVGLFSGRMEFGPRALGSRSILADARLEKGQRLINQKIKFRESWRPFAPMVLREYVADYFDFDHESPYMLFVAPVSERVRRSVPALSWDGGTLDLTAAVALPRSDIPAVTHVDGSARLQTVSCQDKTDARALLEAFHKRTGCPVLVNTSFNIRGEPIVCTPLDALVCFLNTDLDLLVLEDRILFKGEQPRDLREQKPGKAYALD